MVPGARIEGVLTGSNGRPASKYKVIGEISEPQPGERQAEVNTDGEVQLSKLPRLVGTG